MVDVLKIGITDVFLEDFGEGAGKITVSDWENGAFTYYWGSMGEGYNLRLFLKKTNADYFARKLCNKKDKFDAKLSVKSVRKAFRDFSQYDLPWYKYPTAQKELREAITDLENSYSEDHFINKMCSIVDNLMCYELTREEERDFIGKLGDFFNCEPWHFIETKPSDEYLFLYDLHNKIKKVA